MTDTARLFWLLLEAILADPQTEVAKPRDVSPPVEMSRPYDVKPSPVEIECRLGVSEVGNRKSIVALASAGAPQTIDYVLEVETMGVNRSKSRQRGTADLVPGQEQSLATAKVSMNAGEQLTGRLVIDWNGSYKECLLP